ncbi:MAG: hypothetical protein IJ638_02040 [Alphaproteobacteria bacterium]|nr:hypothetical protein [Alphaproteobacteria bacterium]
MKKVSSLVLGSVLSLLTACGGGGSPVSTLGEISNPTTPTNISDIRNNTTTTNTTPVQLSIKTSVDNKAEIVAYVEGLGIDLTEDIDDTTSGDTNRSASSKRRTSTNNSAKTVSLDTKYNIAQKKYTRAKNLLDKGINDIRNAAEDIVVELLKFFGLWRDNHFTTKEEAVAFVNDDSNKDAIINVDKDVLAEKMTYNSLKLDQVVFKKSLWNDNEDSRVNYILDENGNVKSIVYSEKKGCGDNCFLDERENQVYDLDKFKAMSNGLLKNDINSDEGSAYSYFVKDNNGKYKYIDSYSYYTFEEVLAHLRKVHPEWNVNDNGVGTNGKILKFDYKESDSMILGGASVKLSYSDFGILMSETVIENKDINVYDTTYDGVHQLFFGGYENKRIASSDNYTEMNKMVQDNGAMEFSGRAIGGTKMDDINDYLFLDGTVKLKIDENAKQTTMFEFDNFLNFKYENGVVSTYGDYDDKYNNFFREKGEHFLMSSYYGDTGTPSEVVGRFHYSEHDEYGDDGHMLEISFGAKKQ